MLDHSASLGDVKKPQQLQQQHDHRRRADSSYSRNSTGSSSCSSGSLPHKALLPPSSPQRSITIADGSDRVRSAKDGKGGGGRKGGEVERQRGRRAEGAAPRKGREVGRRGNGDGERATTFQEEATATTVVVVDPAGLGKTEGFPDDEEDDWWLPRPPPQVVAVLPRGSVNSRRSLFAERQSVFAGSRVAGECTPAAARLLSLMDAAGPVAEHM